MYFNTISNSALNTLLFKSDPRGLSRQNSHLLFKYVLVANNSE